MEAASYKWIFLLSISNFMFSNFTLFIYCMRVIPATLLKTEHKCPGEIWRYSATEACVIGFCIFVCTYSFARLSTMKGRRVSGNAMRLIGVSENFVSLGGCNGKGREIRFEVI